MQANFLNTLSLQALSPHEQKNIYGGSPIKDKGWAIAAFIVAIAGYYLVPIFVASYLCPKACVDVAKSFKENPPASMDILNSNNNPLGRYLDRLTADRASDISKKFLNSFQNGDSNAIFKEKHYKDFLTNSITHDKYIRSNGRKAAMLSLLPLGVFFYKNRHYKTSTKSA